KTFIQASEHRAALRERRLGDADAERDLVGIGVGQALHRIDVNPADLLRRLGGHLLDIHAALGGGHQHDLLRAAVDHHAGIELLLDVGAFFDQQTPHLLALGSGLVRDELHAEDFFRPGTHFVDRFGDLYAAAFAAPTGVDLRLYHPDAAAELLR